MPKYGTFKFKIPMTPANRLVTKRVTDENDKRRTKITWDPLLTDEVLKLMSYQLMGIHNVREPKTNTDVMRGVRDSLENSPSEFWLQHNGFVFVADKVRDLEDIKGKWLEFSFDFDNGYQGCLNGNSSRATILEAVEGGLMEHYTETGVRPQLSIAIYTGLTADEQLALGIGRNEQFSVTDSTVANANGLYDPIKGVLVGTKIADKVSYKQNEVKPIHVDKIVQTLVALDNIGFPDSETNPIIAYVSKTSPRNYFEAHPDRMARLMPRVPELLSLRDIVARDFVEFYKSHPRAADVRRSHEVVQRNGETVKVPGFFRYTGISEKTTTLHALGTTNEYHVPEAMIMPVISAFRAVLESDPQKTADWTVKGGFPAVLKVWAKIGPSVVRKMVTASAQFGTPNSAAKSDITWGNCYEAMADGMDTMSVA